MLYFAYGSNLRSSQMMRLCPEHEFLAPARLDGYRLAFTLADHEWQGGVADVVPAPGEHVWGALYDISSNDLARLDDYEGFAADSPGCDHDYIRRTVSVIMAGQEIRSDAWCYFVHQPRDQVAPSARYAEALVEGARERDLPSAYCRKLATLLRRSLAG
jgi:gamma-glutamylcyclotransferase (GGCT)/AIG2-like uncharacterized protein YtfP